jgi:hypothetical protein
MSSDTLFTDVQIKRLTANGSKGISCKNLVPVAHLQIRKLGYKFLLTELDPDDTRYAFGLCDYDTDIRFEIINLQTLESKAKQCGDRLKPTDDFIGEYNLAVYAKAAVEFGCLDLHKEIRDFQRSLKRFSKGKNIDPNRNLNDLTYKLSW